MLMSADPQMSVVRVGAVIVVGGWESLPQGEAAIRSLETTVNVGAEGRRS
jgi:hypothetical protein